MRSGCEFCRALLRSLNSQLTTLSTFPPARGDAPPRKAKAHTTRLGPCAPGQQPGFHSGQRTGAVADSIFHRLAQFRERPVETVGLKQRVVAKAVSAAGREQDSPFAHALKDPPRQFDFIRVTNRRTRLPTGC